jgi:hypothetical protein
VRQTAELIDVIWFRKGSGELACAFEVEQSTSIYSGILRMKDLALSLPEQGGHFYVVAPETREKEVVAQMTRPAFLSEAKGFQLGYLPSGELKAECDAMCRYGVDRCCGKLRGHIPYRTEQPACLAEDRAGDASSLAPGVGFVPERPMVINIMLGVWAGAAVRV